MRIAFVGKGGSGKTTLSHTFIKFLLSKNKPVLAIDADINQHLGAALGLNLTDTHPLGPNQKELKNILAGNNPLIETSSMMKTTPPGNGSTIFSNIDEAVQALSSYSVSDNNLHFIPIGEQTEDDLAIRCYHSKTGAVELLLNHLMDGKDEYIVVDMTAGADAFASGLYDKFDMTVLVVEPTIQSVGVFSQYKEQAEKLGVHIRAIGNKVHDEDDHQFLQDKLGDSLIAVFGYSSFIRAAERGIHHDITELEPENIQALNTVKETLDGCEKEWDSYLERTKAIHRKNALSWGNASSEKNLEEQIDDSFQYPQ